MVFPTPTKRNASLISSVYLECVLGILFQFQYQVPPTQRRGSGSAAVPGEPVIPFILSGNYGESLTPNGEFHGVIIVACVDSWWLLISCPAAGCVK